ncbi:hypothetical protein GCM10009737_33230 [Nocardioides lentus]|uniref:HEAT repeat domain-containing protein n=1 Tax=Nocardioides lentus TaxID=338077 RepID=A0ABP5B2U0_9ACTN
MRDPLPRLTDGPSIYELVRDDLDGLGRLTTPRLKLPDEPEPAPGDLPWAHGALDGVNERFGREADPVQAAVVASALVAALREPTPPRLWDLHLLLQEEGAAGYVEPLLDQLVATRPDPEALSGLATWLATTSAHRDPVKIGLTLLGLIGTDAVRDVVLTLGAHEELTRQAALALHRGSSSPDRDVWTLAQRVEEWGRIECVHLLRGTTDPEIKDWLLRDGYRNGVLLEYLAFTAASTGDLLGALRRPGVDRALLTSAGEIIEAVIEGGPAEDLGDLGEAPALLDAYLDLLAERAETVVDLDAAVAILTVLLDEHPTAASEIAWPEADRARIAGKAAHVVGFAFWPDVVREALAADARGTFHRANRVAPRVGVDTFDLHLDRVRADPTGSSWFHAWQVADTERRRDVLVGVARDVFLPDGPDDTPVVDVGVGVAWRSPLDWTLQELRSHPGLGADLVLLGLTRSQNPNMALQVLGRWPVVAWPVGATDALTRLRGCGLDSYRDSHVEGLLRRATTE